METLKSSPLFMFLIISSLTMTSTSAMASMHSHEAMKGAYWPSWAIDFPPSAIDTSLFTHIYYAFVNPNNVTFKLDIETENSNLNNFMENLPKKNPPLKTMLSIGGEMCPPEKFAEMASRSSTRKTFIQSTIDVARQYGFDGVDLDWEFPNTPEDMNNFGLLLHEWRDEVNKEAQETYSPPLLLSAGTYFAAHISIYRTDPKYPIASINENLDWINARCYDYHGKSDKSATGAHAALYDPTSNLSTSSGLQSWIKAEIKREKLIMGLPMYGRTWKLKNPKHHGIGAAAVGIGPGDDKGMMSYSVIVEFNKENGATVVYDRETVSTYSYAGTSWIGYDNVTSIQNKIKFAKEKNLGGYFFWALGDDSNWTLSRAASMAWNSKN